jgi:hypothetical protein
MLLSLLTMKVCWSLLLLTLLVIHSPAANDVANDAQNDSKSPTQLKPLLHWSFDTPEIGTWTGTKKIEPAGPQSPIYPLFPKDNKAAYFPGNGASLVVKESDVPEANLRFAQGDSLTLEAWVDLDKLSDDSYVYLIGKGRNKNAAFASENQNYALRLKGVAGEARPTFLFRSVADKPDSSKNYHRWVANDGFTPGTGWHHVAVTYTFGTPESMLAYIDGKPAKGTWDMAGKTKLPPVNDGDDLVIGTGNGGGAGNTLQGWLDEVAIHRETLPETLLATRYQFVPPVPKIDENKLPKGAVLMQICEEGVPAKNAWPVNPVVTETYQEDVFGFIAEPQKYITTGVRADRANPHVLRAAAKVTLPAGKHRLLLRGRSATHLIIDGKQILSTPFTTGDSGGHGHVSEQDEYLNLGPDFRFAPPGTLESWCEFESSGKTHIVMVEQIIGGIVGKSRRRPELGEMVVAISYQGSEQWELLSPGTRKVPYNDTSWAAYAKEREAHLDEVNSKQRAKAFAAQGAYWKKRRQAADQWLKSTPEVPLPALPEGFPALNPIDHFIALKLAQVKSQQKASQAGTVNFYKDIRPILETKCFDCHQGTKVKGGLKLDSLAAALKGGKSDGAAITPHHPETSALISRVSTPDEDEIMPPKGNPLTSQEIALLTTWVKEGANWPEFEVQDMTLTELTDDLSFLRRVTLDTVGVVPTLAEIKDFTNDKSADKRSKVIDRLLNDSRWADHWMGYWQDVLAENPNMLNPTLNNTGPFRWWIHEALIDDKPMDVFATELIRMEGSERLGGPAGFSTASQNDVPMAAKGTIVSTAFLGVEMKCARCHDSPSHKSLQEDLFSLAAMLGQKEIEVPSTSSVPMDKLHAGGRKPLIQVTLKPGSKIAPKWPFAEFCDETKVANLAQDMQSDRDRLAALITAPQNERFSQVMANRLWARLMGRGIVEPVADWEKGSPSHPELLKWLGREFVRGGYSMKSLARVILNSHAYQRATDLKLRETSPLFTSPAPRRLEAEQIVDSLFSATEKPFTLEEVSLDIDGRRDMGNSISLGQPRRSWMLTSTSNERDRPSLALPRIQAVTDVLGAFGWRGSRQDPVSKRETDPTAIQPAILSNGTVGIWLTRLSDDHGVTALALQDQSLDQLLDSLFLKLLTRLPTSAEREAYRSQLSEGYANRVQQQPSEEAQPVTRTREKYVSWSNHLDPVSTTLRQEQELAARRGDAPTIRLAPQWREHLEDALWAILNAPEWVYTP